MIEMTREEILTLYKEGGFLAESAPFHDWWKYDADYKPAYEPGGSLARMIEPGVPRQMKEAGELEIAYGDTFAKMYVYKLSNNAVLHAAGLDPDEVGAQMKQAAEEALARVKPQKGEDDAADLIQPGDSLEVRQNKELRTSRALLGHLREEQALARWGKERTPAPKIRRPLR
jgi:hypothetical protein